MSPRLLAMALAPLLGLFIIALGNGFMSSLTTLRLGAAGESASTIGIVSSTYFIGLTLGAIFNDRLILRIGHIRAYTSFASLIAVTILLQGLFYDVTWWSVLRLINGWAAVGVFLVIESWLLLAGDAKIRGRLLALYMIAFYGAGVIAQAGLGEITQLGDTAPFMLAGVLAALSVLPIVILPRVSPLLEQVEPLKPRQLLGVAPSGLVGCFGSGVAIAGIYALLPLYLQRIGLEVGEVGNMMAWVIHAADRAPSDALVPMIQGLLLINSLGSAMAPVAISPMMTEFGEAGLFWAFAVVNLAMLCFFMWRRGKRPAAEHPAPFAASTTFSPTGAELRVTEDLMHAAQEHPPLEPADPAPAAQSQAH